MTVARREAWWAALAALLVLGCGSNETLVIVTVQGAPPGASGLRGTVTLDGKQATLPAEVTDLQEFGLLLPPQASGPIALDAEALDGGCVVGRGHTDSVLSGHTMVRLNLPLDPVAPAQCNPMN